MKRLSPSLLNFLIIILAGFFVLPGMCLAEPDQEEPPPPTSGPWRIRSVEFRGLKKVTSSEAKEVMEIRGPGVLELAQWPVLEEDAVNRDQQRLVQLYHEHGFFQAKVQSEIKRHPEDRTVTVVFRAQENQPTLVEEIRFLFPDDKIRTQWDALLRKRLSLEIGRRFSLEAYKLSKQEISHYLSNEGYPLHLLQSQVQVHAQRNRAVVVLKVDPGSQVQFGPTRIVGNQTIKEKYIRREIPYARGQPYSLDVLQKTQRALLNTGFFTSVSLEPQLKKVLGRQVPLVLEVKERAPHSVRLGLGWGTEDQFRMRVSQINRNLLGLGDTLTFEGKLSSIYQGMIGRFSLPHVLGAGALLDMSGGIEQVDNEAYESRRLFFQPRLVFRWGPHWSWYLAYNVETDHMLDLKSLVDDPVYDSQDFFFASIPVGFMFDNRDSALNPRRGTYFKAEADTSLTMLGSDLGFVRTVADLRHVLPFPWLKNWYLAGRMKAGFVFPFPSNERIPLIKLFFPGGADSVRGYPYQRLGPLDGGGKPLGGEASFEGSLELRFPIYKEFGGVLFLDGGNAYRDIYGDWATLRFTVGAGLRYQTPVGPLRLDFGYQVNPPRGDEIDRYQIYLSVGQAF